MCRKKPNEEMKKLRRTTRQEKTNASGARTDTFWSRGFAMLPPNSRVHRRSKAPLMSGQTDPDLCTELMKVPRRIKHFHLLLIAAHCVHSLLPLTSSLVEGKAFHEPIVSRIHPMIPIYRRRKSPWSTECV